MAGTVTLPRAEWERLRAVVEAARRALGPHDGNTLNDVSRWIWVGLHEEHRALRHALAALDALADADASRGAGEGA